ncbi:MAG TPA: hypothetical protein VNC50_15245, partial [Planctomycetia bacterium]|nr:hypothetical protein [Planctomycetia bacterium]
NFEAVSERTHQLTLGGPGRKVKGRVASVEGDNAIPASFPWPDLRLGAYLSFPWRYGDKIPPNSMPKLPPPVALEGDGTFTIENLPAGSYNVQIIATAPAKAESGPGAAPAARFYALDRIEIPLVDDDEAAAILDVGPIRVGRIAAKP